MPNFVGKETIDTVSTDANCVYPASPLGGVPNISPNVLVNGKPDSALGGPVSPLQIYICAGGSDRETKTDSHCKTKAKDL